MYKFVLVLDLYKNYKYKEFILNVVCTFLSKMIKIWCDSEVYRISFFLKGTFLLFKIEIYCFRWGRMGVWMKGVVIGVEI